VAYCNWQDAWEHLDKQAITQPDLDTSQLQTLCEDAAIRFDNRLRLRYVVPFTEALAPDSFTIGKKVTSRWAAAKYLGQTHSSEGTAEQNWWADQLDAAAEEFMALLESRKAPTDATANTAGLVFAATDGMEDYPFVAADPAAGAISVAPIFRRERLVSGSTTHW
jgi:hypothetical protein